MAPNNGVSALLVGVICIGIFLPALAGATDVAWGNLDANDNAIAVNANNNNKATRDTDGEDEAATWPAGRVLGVSSIIRKVIRPFQHSAKGGDAGGADSHCSDSASSRYEHSEASLRFMLRRSKQNLTATRIGGHSYQLAEKRLKVHGCDRNVTRASSQNASCACHHQSTQHACFESFEKSHAGTRSCARNWCLACQWVVRAEAPLCFLCRSGLQVMYETRTTFSARTGCSPDVAFSAGAVLYHGGPLSQIWHGARVHCLWSNTSSAVLIIVVLVGIVAVV